MSESDRLLCRNCVFSFDIKPIGFYCKNHDRNVTEDDFCSFGEKRNMEDKKIIYAVDFDGTLCENKWPEIGEPNMPLIEFLVSEQEKGNVVILWTMREGKALYEAVRWLVKECDFVPDIVNDNTDEMKKFYGNNPRKVFANYYIDDHNDTSVWSQNLPFRREETV